MITLIGLGPDGGEGMSVAARDALRAATRPYLRTARHPAAVDLACLGIDFEAFDDLYESAETFDAVYDAIADRLLTEAARGDVAYAVPGHPLVAEESVRRLLARARAAGVLVRVAGSASFLEAALGALGVVVADGLLVLDALALPATRPRPDLPTLLYQVYDRDIASAAKLALMEEYPDDWEVRVVRQAGVRGAEAVETVALHRLDRVEVDHLTAVYVPALPPERRRPGFDDLVKVMARLRGEGGCPWDREQDHRTLTRYLVEESYEAIEAIEEDDLDALREELGDVLLQVVFHAQIEAEVGTWTARDVIGGIVEKLVRRHPHVFGEVGVSGADEVLRNWETIKRAEKGAGWRESVLDGVPAGMPALMRALEISKRVVKVGFEWERFEDVLAKMEEETYELRQAVAQGDRAAVAAEVGDLLFTLVNVARWQRVDPEEALRDMVRRFSARFRHLEERAREQGRALTDMSLADLDALWDEAKRAQ